MLELAKALCHYHNASLQKMMDITKRQPLKTNYLYNNTVVCLSQIPSQQRPRKLDIDVRVLT